VARTSPLGTRRSIWSICKRLCRATGTRSSGSSAGEPRLLKCRCAEENPAQLGGGGIAPDSRRGGLGEEVVLLHRREATDGWGHDRLTAPLRSCSALGITTSVDGPTPSAEGRRAVEEARHQPFGNIARTREAAAPRRRPDRGTALNSNFHVQNDIQMTSKTGK
jgi:hypothetical protein